MKTMAIGQNGIQNNLGVSKEYACATDPQSKYILMAVTTKKIVKELAQK